MFIRCRYLQYTCIFGGCLLDVISQAKKEQIIELVNSQKKVKLEWLATITKTPVEVIIANVDDLGLVVEDEYISFPLEKKESTTDREEVEYTSLQPKPGLIAKSRGAIIGVVLMLIAAAFALPFGLLMIIVLGGYLDGWFYAIGAILLVLCVGLVVGAIIILRKLK